MFRSLYLLLLSVVLSCFGCQVSFASNLNADHHEETKLGSIGLLKSYKSEDPQGEPLSLSIYSVLADPGKYSNRELSFPAFWASRPGCTGDWLYVFPTKDDAFDFERLNGISICLRGTLKPNLKNGSRVRVIGLFHPGKAERGESGSLDVRYILTK